MEEINEQTIQVSEDKIKKFNIFAKMKSNRKMQWFFFVACMLVLFIVYFPANSWIKKNVVEKKIHNSNIEFDSSVITNFDEVKIENGKIYISGCVLKLNAELVDVKVVLGSDMEEEYIYRTELHSRNIKEYLAYFEDSNEYRNSGFNVIIDEEDLLNDTCYKLLLYITYDTKKENDSITAVKKIETEYYLYNGTVYGYNPQFFEAPQFSDSKMVQVVTSGRVCGYNKEYGAWLYVYEDNLYWILDTSVSGNQENVMMFFHLYTNHEDRLPEHRQQYGIDNKDFMFKNNEILQDGNYRVASVKVGNQYPVTYVRTGQYDQVNNKDVWSVMFQWYINE